MGKKERAKLYMDYLTAEGYRPYIDEDGDVVFKSEGLTYYITIDANDEEYFRLVLPNFWRIESGEELAAALYAANHATMTTKVAKVYVRSDGKDTMAAIEMFVKPPENFKFIFSRAMSALKTAVNDFVSIMREITK